MRASGRAVRRPGPSPRLRLQGGDGERGSGETGCSLELVPHSLLTSLKSLGAGQRAGPPATPGRAPGHLGLALGGQPWPCKCIQPLVPIARLFPGLPPGDAAHVPSRAASETELPSVPRPHRSGHHSAWRRPLREVAAEGGRQPSRSCQGGGPGGGGQGGAGQDLLLLWQLSSSVLQVWSNRPRGASFELRQLPPPLSQRPGDGQRGKGADGRGQREEIGPGGKHHAYRGESTPLLPGLPPAFLPERSLPRLSQREKSKS